MVKKARKHATELVKTGLVLGVGADVVHRVGGPTGGITTLSKFQPVIGTTIGAGTVLRTLKELQPKKKKRRKK